MDDERREGGVPPTEPWWGVGYLELLRSLGVADGRRGIYVLWVREFIQSRAGSTGRQFGRAEIRSFVEGVRRDTRVSAGAVEAAMSALEVFHTFTFGLGPGQGGSELGGAKGDGRGPPVVAGAVVRQPPSQVDWAALEAAVRSASRAAMYAPKTEKAYTYWVRRFIEFHGGRRPSEMGGPEVGRFLGHLAAGERVSASTRNQALNGLAFFYRRVVGREVDVPGAFERARRTKQLPVVLSRRDVQSVLERMTGVAELVARLMYGTGMRLSEALLLRVNDLSLDRDEVTVGARGEREGRRVPLPPWASELLAEHLERRKRQFEVDRLEGVHAVDLPGRVTEAQPEARYEWGWQFVFAAERHSTDPRSGARQRCPVHEILVQRAVRRAAAAARISARVTPQTLRHSFAAHLIDSGQDIHTVQAQLGHGDVSTTMLYSRVLRRRAR